MIRTDRLFKDIGSVVLFLAVLWGVFVLDLALPLQEWTGLVPRDLQGLTGIVTMTFLHVDLAHLAGNTVPLLVLLSLLTVSRPNPWMTAAAIGLLGGALLWVFGRNGVPGLVEVHVGASVLIYGLVTYLIAVGVMEREPAPLTIAVVVGVLYGASTLVSIIPFGNDSSWDGHLAGAVAGILIALWQRQSEART